MNGQPFVCHSQNRPITFIHYQFSQLQSLNFYRIGERNFLKNNGSFALVLMRKRPVLIKVAPLKHPHCGSSGLKVCSGLVFCVTTKPKRQHLPPWEGSDWLRNAQTGWEESRWELFQVVQYMQSFTPQTRLAASRHKAQRLTSVCPWRMRVFLAYLQQRCLRKQ